MPKVSYNVPPDTLVFMLPEPEFTKWSNCYFWPSEVKYRTAQRRGHGNGPKKVRMYRRRQRFHPDYSHKLPF
jgi:hypothetical protein